MYKILVLICLGLVISCQPKEEAKNVLANVYGQKLTLEDLAAEVNLARTKKDSAQIISREVDNWVMTEMLFKVAKDQDQDNDRLERLVDDYRKSIYINELEQTVLAHQLDTMISEREIDTFLSVHKEAYTLQEDIVKVLFVKVPKRYDKEPLTTLWETENIPALKTMVKRVKGLSLLNLDEWIAVSRIASLIPPTLLDQVNYAKPSENILRENGKIYFVKVLENMKAGEAAPKSFVRDKIRQRILINRSRAFLTNWRRELYYNNIQNKDIHIYNE